MVGSKKMLNMKKEITNVGIPQIMYDLNLTLLNQVKDKPMTKDAEIF